MRHLREFSEWNPDEWDERSLDARVQDLKKIGYKDPADSEYDLDFRFPVPFMGAFKTRMFHGLVLHVRASTSGLEKEDESLLLGAIAKMNYQPISVNTLRGEDGYPITVNAERPDSDGIEALVDFYETLDVLVKKGVIDFNDISFKEDGCIYWGDFMKESYYRWGEITPAVEKAFQALLSLESQPADAIKGIRENGFAKEFIFSDSGSRKGTEWDYFTPGIVAMEITKEGDEDWFIPVVFQTPMEGN